LELEQCFFVGTGFETDTLSEALSSQFSRVPSNKIFESSFYFETVPENRGFKDSTPEDHPTQNQTRDDITKRFIKSSDE
jgi:hypothetical protein